MFREKNKINYGATPRNNTLMQLDQQAAAASTALTNAMNQPGFVFGETKTHPLPTPEPLPNTPDIEKRVQDLSAQILAANNFEKIATEAITTTPCFMKEERLEDLVNAISNQKGDFTSVIYFNGSRNRLDATFSEKDYQDQLAKLKDLAKKDKRIIVIDHLYTEDEGYDDKRTAERKKVIPMGTIRADMIDAIKSTVDFLKIKDPKIIGIDADTYKMDDNYIMGMTKALDTTRNKFLKGATRWYDVAESKGDERAFILERAWLSQITPWMNNKEANKTLTGATFGFKLSDYNKAGGFLRDPNQGKMYEGNFSGGEDSALEEAFQNIGIQGQGFQRKIYVDPRRGQDATNQGHGFHGQWGAQEFKPIPRFDVKTHTTPEYKQLTEISRKLLNGEVITDAEQQKFETSLNGYIYPYTKQEDEASKFLTRRRNLNTTSKYKMSYVRKGDHTTFKLEKKT